MPDSFFAPVLDFIERHSSFLIVGHKEPDGDCVCSQLALASYLTRLGKRALPCSAGPFKRPEVKPFESRFASEPGPEWGGAAVIVVDCSNLQRVGSLEPSLAGRPLAFIDHHAAGEASGEALCVDASAPSVTYIIQRLIQEAGAALTRDEAELLFLGLCTDTGFFRHLGPGSERVFDSASEMVAAGASPKAAHESMYGGKSAESRILLGLILSRLESHFGGRLYSSYETLEDTERYGLEGRDSDNLYQLIQSIAGCEAVFIVRQEGPENCTVGFRSKAPVDVSAVAARFGGGGHKQAAGVSVPGHIGDVKARILEAFSGVFSAS